MEIDKFKSNIKTSDDESYLYRIVRLYFSQNKIYFVVTMYLLNQVFATDVNGLSLIPKDVYVLLLDIGQY